MCILQIHVECYDRFFEVFSDEVVNTELIVENAVSQLLLDLFDEVTMDEVTIRFSSNLHMGLQHCSIQMQAQCACQSFTLLPRTKENMELAVENSICSILRELFGTVNVDNVKFSPPPWEYEYDHIIVSSHS
jgi:hypothetical protein